MKALVVLVVFAVATYLLVRVMQHRGLVVSDKPRAHQPRQPAGRRPVAEPRPMIAPDDDEEFLRDLDRRRLNPEDE